MTASGKLIWEDPVSRVIVERQIDAVHLRYRVRHPRGHEVLIDAGGNVLHARTTRSQNELGRFIDEQIVPRTESHRGNLVLHAAMVGLSSAECILLVGATGNGKSTLSASFLSSGQTVYGDDAAIIRFSSNTPMARSLVTSIRLLPDSQHLVSSFDAEDPEERPSSKSSFSLSDGLSPPPFLKISAIFALQQAAGDAPRVDRLRGREACVRLIANSFALDPTDRSQAANRLVQIGRLLQAVPVFELHVPHDFRLLSKAKAMLVEHALAQTGKLI